MFKRLIYGLFPYCWTKLFHYKLENLHYYQYIMNHGYSRHLYEFRGEYNDMVIELHKDKNGLFYIMIEGKRLYFKRNMLPQKIMGLYKELVIEQDRRSAHHYFDNIESELKGKTLLDIGGAEGLISLLAIEVINHIYIFECDALWIEALNATFSPWKDRVTIVNKLVGTQTEGECLALDEFFSDKLSNDLFLKMDIEGSEKDALRGAQRLLTTSKNLAFAICTYHEEDDGKEICSILDNCRCTYYHQRGFFRQRNRSVLVRGKNGVM